MIDLVHRKERITFTAIDVMNELGVQALSTKKIAQYENISESTVFKHFKNKNDILIAVLAYYSKYDQDIRESLKLRAISGVDGIEYIVNAYITYYENYPAITAIDQGLFEMRYNEALRPMVDKIISGRFDALTVLIAESQHKNELNSSISEELLANIILGTLNNIISRWRMKNYQFSLKDTCQNALNCILKAYES